MTKFSLLFTVSVLLLGTTTQLTGALTLVGEPPFAGERSSRACIDRRSAVIGSTAAVGASLVSVWSNPLPAFASGEDFLDGPRGLKYKVLKEGEGESPVRGQKIDAKYTLWTGGFGDEGGKQVDSNTGFLGRPLSVVVGVGAVIKRWDLTLLDMKLGESRRIIVPSDIGYGDKGAGGSIPPKATLYFEMEITGMDKIRELNDAQKKWLEDNPL